MERYRYQLDNSQGKCGIGIVIVNEKFTDEKYTRKGAEKEVESLKKLLEEEFSLDVHVYQDLKWKDMFQLMSLLSGKRTLKSKVPQIEEKDQTFVMAISSHGTEQGICTSDMKIFPFSMIKTFFSGKSCKFLIGKPKMFLFNCCRTLKDGKERKEIAYPMFQEQIETDGLDSDGEPNLDPKLRVASCWSDFITVNFCGWSIASLRGTESGSFAIQEFCQAFKEYGRNMDFQSFMTRFTYEVKIKIYEIAGSEENPVTQCPEVTTTLDRLLVFPPRLKQKVQSRAHQHSEKEDIISEVSQPESGKKSMEDVCFSQENSEQSSIIPAAVGKEDPATPSQASKYQTNPASLTQDENSANETQGPLESDGISDLDQNT